MSRKRKAPKKIPILDPKYKSSIIASKKVTKSVVSRWGICKINKIGKNHQKP